MLHVAGQWSLCVFLLPQFNLAYGDVCSIQSTNYYTHSNKHYYCLRTGDGYIKRAMPFITNFSDYEEKYSRPFLPKKENTPRIVSCGGYQKWRRHTRTDSSATALSLFINAKCGHMHALISHMHLICLLISGVCHLVRR